MTSVKTKIEHLLMHSLRPQSLEIIGDSERHQGHKEVINLEETHFTIFMVASAFEGKNALQRHRLVHNVLKDLLSSKIHALSLKLQAPSEIQEIVV